MHRRSASLPILTLVGLAAALAAPWPCVACSCATDDPRQHTAWADLIFRGQVVEVEEPSTWEEWQTLLPWYWNDPDALQTEARLRADTMWKGSVQSEFLVAAGPGTCGITFTEGVDYIVYAKGREDAMLSTNRCVGTISTDHVDEVAVTLAALGPGTPVTGSATPYPAGADGTRRPLGLALVTGLAAAGGLALRRRTKRS